MTHYRTPVPYNLGQRVHLAGGLPLTSTLPRSAFCVKTTSEEALPFAVIRGLEPLHILSLGSRIQRTEATSIIKVT